MQPRRLGARVVSKEELLRTADVISIHMVLSARTIGLIGAAEFALMKPSARLVNTSRGPLVVEAALLDALANRQISGAAIDVYDVEPLPEDHPYRRADNMLAHSSYRLWHARSLRALLSRLRRQHWRPARPKTGGLAEFPGISPRRASIPSNDNSLMRQRQFARRAPLLAVGSLSRPSSLGLCGMHDWPDYLRDAAAMYRKLAEQADDPVVKNEMLELASVCEEVATGG
jgi:D-isomer specific 2-hydroxyacid dehydrogenase, NAD binding domain